MCELDFKKVRFSVIVTCISENGKIENMEDIEDDIKNNLEDVFDNAVDVNNNIFKYEVCDAVELSDGRNKTIQK